MRFRTTEDIYPSYYFAPPMDEDVHRECMSHLNESIQVARDVYDWIERKDCPYMREHYATMMARCLTENAEEGMVLEYSLRLEVEARLVRIIREAQTDQVAEEMVHKEQQQMGLNPEPPCPVQTERYTAEERLRQMERQIAYLKQEVKNLYSERSTPMCSYIMPGQIKTRQEIDAELREACCKSAPALANYLKKAQTIGYLDFRGDSLGTIYDTLCQYYPIRYKYDALYRSCRNTDFFPSVPKK